MPKVKEGPSADSVRLWMEYGSDLKEAKEKEMEFRKEIVDHVLVIGSGKGNPKTGVIGPFELTATPKIGLSVDKELLKTLWPSLSKEEKACFKFDPSLKLKEYKALPKDSKVHRAIEGKPGAPTLVLKRYLTEEKEDD